MQTLQRELVNILENLANTTRDTTCKNDLKQAVSRLKQPDIQIPPTQKNIQHICELLIHALEKYDSLRTPENCHSIEKQINDIKNSPQIKPSR